MQLAPLPNNIQEKFLKIIDHIIEEDHNLDSVNVRLFYSAADNKYYADCSSCGKIWTITDSSLYLNDTTFRLLKNILDNEITFRGIIEYRKKRKKQEEITRKANDTINSLEV